MKKNMDPVFGWGPECRFSWGTAKEMLDCKGAQVKVAWPEDVQDDAEDDLKLTTFFTKSKPDDTDSGGLKDWFGKKISAEVF